MVVNLTGCSFGALTLLLLDRVEVIQELIAGLVPLLFVQPGTLNFSAGREVFKGNVIVEVKDGGVRFTWLLLSTVLDVKALSHWLHEEILDRAVLLRVTRAVV